MRIGFVGIGAMGQPMALHLVAAGYAVVVCDTDATRTAVLAQRGADVAESATAVADGCDFLLACLPSLGAAEAVAAGAIAGGRARAFVNLGTTGSAFSRQTARACSAAGKTFLDAPISGGPPGAEAATLGIMCSGDRDTFDTLKEALDILASKVVYVNDQPGAAQTMKLVNNILSFGNLAVALEAMTLGVKAGLDPELMLDVINVSSGRNTATESKIPNHVLTRSFDYGGSMAIVEKDLELWRREAEAHEAPMWLGTNIRTLYLQCMAEFGRDRDMTELALTLERLAGMQIPKTR